MIRKDPLRIGPPRFGRVGRRRSWAWFCSAFWSGFGLSPLGSMFEPGIWLAIFVATVIGIMLRPLPIGAVAIIGVTATVLTGTLDISEALSGFGNRVVWLIVVAFLVARAFTKTGLGARVAYSFMAYMGRSSLGLAYSLVADRSGSGPNYSQQFRTGRGCALSHSLLLVQGLRKRSPTTAPPAR